MHASVPRLLGFLILCVAALLGFGPVLAGVPPPAGAGPEAGISPEEAYGIAPETLRLTSAGYFIDFRFCVLDPAKASQFIHRNVKTYLVDQSSGAVLISPDAPKIGGLRQTSATLEYGKVYFILYGNPGKYLKPGSRVTVIIGDLRLEDLTIS